MNLQFLLVVIASWFLFYGARAEVGIQSEATSKEPCQCLSPDADKMESPEEKSLQMIGLLRAVNAIHGKVTDDGGKSIKGASIKLFANKETIDSTGSTLERGKQLAICGTDDNGEYCFPDIKPGIYTLIVSAGKEYYSQERMVRVMTKKLKTSDIMVITLSRIQ